MTATTTRTRKATTRKPADLDTTPTAADRAREFFGVKGPALMSALKAAGFVGRTLEERAGQWAESLTTDGTATETADVTDTAAEVVPAGWESVGVDCPDVPADLGTAADPAGADTTDATDAPAEVVSAAELNLNDAARQWAERPADERYWTVADALDATRHHKETAREVSFKWDDAALAVAPDGAGINLILPDGTAPALTHYAAGQLCSRIKAPHQYLAKLPTETAVACLEAGMVAEFGGKDRGGNALVHQNGTTKLRSLTSDKYARFWNCEVYESLLPLTERGWRTPPARPANLGDKNDTRIRRATEADVLTRRNAGGGLAVSVGDWISPAGIYASDHDMFAFLVNEDIRIQDGSEDGLARGFFCSNSEVGAGALKVKAFYYRGVCGNHIVWGAEHVVDVSVRHVGSADGIRQRFAVECRQALEAFTDPDKVRADQDIVTRARNYMLTSAADPEAARKEVVQAIIAAVSGNRTLKPASGISLGMFDGTDTRPGALQYSALFADLDKCHPYSLWGVVNGLTRYSQSPAVGYDFADERAKVDALVPKLLRLVGATDAPALSA